MTTVYFIRHAQSDSTVDDAFLRPLTPKGMKDRSLVTKFLEDKKIDFAFSSPYQRAIDTIREFTDKHGLDLQIVHDLREHQTISDNYCDEEYFPFIQRYWKDKTYKVPGDESILDLQTRNIRVLKQIIKTCENKNIIIGTHGVTLSAIINYYDEKYGYEDFLAMVKLKPWVVKMTFDGLQHTAIEYINLFEMD